MSIRDSASRASNDDSTGTVGIDEIVLGSSGIRASSFGFGTMTLGADPPREQAFELLDIAVDSGIDLIDTANTYHGGESETVVGEWMKSRGNRQSIVLSSKVRYGVGGASKSRGLGPSTLRNELENSLRRLQTDYLDIWFMHQPDDDVPIDVTLHTLNAIAESGMVRAVGCSNFAAWQHAQAVSLSDFCHWFRPAIGQIMFNAIARGVENEYLPMARKNDIGVMVYNPLAGGLLTGKYNDSEPADGRLVSNAQYRERYFSDQQRLAARQINDVANRFGRTQLELAIRYAADTDGVDSVLLGARTRQQLEQCIAVADAKILSKEERKCLDSVWAGLRGEVPDYCRTNADGPGR